MIKNGIRDIVGVGFGPAALSLAATIHDYKCNGTIKSLNATFLERQPDFAWHTSLMLPGTVINHHHFRDIATPRDPRSEFTFANYLKEKNRIFEFGHLGDTVTRAEWNDYLSWAAHKLDSFVTYNKNVESIGWDDELMCLDIQTDSESFKARNLVLATGLKPRIPEMYTDLLSARVFHSSKFLDKLPSIDGENKSSFLVVGSGQSAAEILIYMRDKYSDSKIYSIHKSVGFKIKESGHLSNTIYFPEETDYFYNLPQEAKKLALRDMHSADYGNINYSTSDSLFKQLYEDKVNGKQNIFMLNRCQVDEVSDHGNIYKVTCSDVHTGLSEEVFVNYIILCTGFYEEAIPSVLSESVIQQVNYDADGLKISREYKVESAVKGLNMYMCGISERTHGISDTQSFSLMAIKAETILNDIIRNNAGIKQKYQQNGKLQKDISASSL